MVPWVNCKTTRYCMPTKNPLISGCFKIVLISRDAALNVPALSVTILDGTPHLAVNLRKLLSKNLVVEGLVELDRVCLRISGRWYNFRLISAQTVCHARSSTVILYRSMSLSLRYASLFCGFRKRSMMRNNDPCRLELDASMTAVYLPSLIYPCTSRCLSRQCTGQTLLSSGQTRSS